MSQFQNSLEFLLKVRAEGQQILDQVSAQIDQFVSAQQKAGSANLSSAGAAKDASAASGELAEAQKQASQAIAASNAEVTLQRGALTGLASQVRAAAAAYIGLAGARRAITLSIAQEQAEQRVLGLLQAQLSSREAALEKQRELTELSSRLQRETGLFGDEEFLGAARQLISVTGRSDLDFDRLLRVSADAAVALYQGNLDTAVRNIARTFGGQAGEIGEVIPELARLRQELAPRVFAEELRKGLVVDLLERRFGGVAAEAADSPSGRLIALRGRFEDQLERIGTILLPGVADGLEVLVVALEGADRTVRRLSGEEVDDAPSDPSRLNRIFAGAARDTLDAASAAALRIANASQERVRSLTTGGQGDSSLADLNRFLQRNLLDLARTLGDGSDEISDAIEAFRDGIPQAQAGPGALPERFVSRIDFDDETRRGLVIQLGLVDELNASLLETEAAFKRLGALDEFPVRLFEGEDLREAEAFFNLAKIGLTQEQGLRDLAKAQDEYAKALARTNALVEAGQITQARRNEVLAESRARLAAVIEETEALASASREEGQRSIDALQSLVDERGDLALDITLGDQTQLGEQLGKAIETAKDRLAEGADDIGALSAEFGERAFGPLVSQLDDVFKTGEASFQGFATAILDTATRLISEAVIGDLLALLLGGTRQSPGASGGGGLFGGALNFVGGLLGFDEGGLVPGPDLGRDSRVIAVRGQEFVVRPEAVRLPGVREHLEAVNSGDIASIDFSRLVPRLPTPLSAVVARELRSTPGYAGGGFVDAVASLGASPSGLDAADVVFGPTRRSGAQGEVVVVPVLPVTRRTAETLLGNRASRDVVRAAAREAAGPPGAAGASGASGAPGARGMPT